MMINSLKIIPFNVSDLRISLVNLIISVVKHQ